VAAAQRELGGDGRWGGLDSGEVYTHREVDTHRDMPRPELAVLMPAEWCSLEMGRRGHASRGFPRQGAHRESGYFVRRPPIVPA
jgi:hypothetical protein